MGLNLKALIAKLNDQTRGTLEGAAGLCLSRTHYDIEVEHFLTKLLDSSSNDFAAIIKHFEVDKSRLTAELARSMVGLWGMSDVIGPVTVITEDAHLLIPGASNISPQTQQLVDEEVRHLIDQAHEEVTQLMSTHRDQLEALTSALLEHETLEQDEAYAAAGLEATREAHLMK